MKKIITLMLMVVLAGCQVRDQQQGQKEQQPAPVEQAPMGLMQAETGIASTTSSAAQNGVSVAANLTSRYNDVRRDRGKPSMPAFLCRGVMLRSTIASTAYSSWNPSPHSQKSGGVSFSYLSKDPNSLAWYSDRKTALSSTRCWQNRRVRGRSKCYVLTRWMAQPN